MANVVARRALAVCGAALLLLSFGGCAATKPAVVPSADDVQAVAVVHVIDNVFEPAEVTIKAGEAVKWEFEGTSAKHDVVADDGSFVSELQSVGSYTHVFESSGDFAYDCSIHSEMRGVVHVTD